MTLERLNQVNDVPVRSVRENAFATYGRVIDGYDFSGLTAYMEQQTPIPESGNIYLASVPEMEQDAVVNRLQAVFYGGMPIEVGYCNGRNTTYNGFEYHKGSEINVAVTDLMLVLGHTWLIRDNTYRVEDAEVFFVEKGTAIELYQTTLHLSPCRVTDKGFKAIVILPRGTNTPLAEKAVTADPESRLLLQTNKWVIAHPEREPLIRQGAFPGLLGENKALYY
ncbi:MAG: DUF4867 family protein [Clostridiales bacterium]|nr:DUF4867 family protein [Clostridiales bacterium]